MSRIERPPLLLATLGAALLLGGTARAAEPERVPTVPRVAVAEDDDGISRPTLALAVGGVTSFASLAGGIMALSRSHTRSAKNEGLIGAQAGLTLSPIFAHAVVGELGRGCLFALIPLAGVAANVTLASTVPDFVAHGGPPIQYTMFIGVAASIFGSAFGVLDAVRVRERKPGMSAFLGGLHVSPMVDRTETGVVVGGSL